MLAWFARLDGSAEFFNQRRLDYRRLSTKQALGSDGRLRFIQTTCREFWKHPASFEFCKVHRV
jgi:hypothetical protein